MDTPTQGRMVRYTFRRRGSEELVTMPAVVTAVGERPKDVNPDPRNPRDRRLVPTPCVSLVVFDHEGSRAVRDAFEDAAASATGGNPELGTWAWPPRASSPPAYLTAPPTPPVTAAVERVARAASKRKR